MTVTNENSRNDYVSNGSAVEYAFTFKILDEADIQVIVTNLAGVEDLLVLTTDYTVDLDADTGLGSITLVTAATVNFTISLLRNMDFEQNTSIQNQGTSQFSGKSFEQALDKLTLLSLQLKEIVGRNIALKKSSLLSGITISDPVANKLLVVDADGNIDMSDSDFTDIEANLAVIAASIADINAIAADIANIDLVAGDLADIDIVAGISAAVQAVAAITAEVQAVAAIDDEVVGVYAIRVAVSAVSAIAAAVTSVAAIAANVTSVAGNAANINIVAGLSAAITSVVANMADIQNAASFNLPTLGGSDAGKFLKVNAGSNGYDLVASANLTLFGALTPSANNVPYFDSGSTMALKPIGTSSGNIPVVGTTSATTALAGLAPFADNATTIAGSSAVTNVTPAGLAAWAAANDYVSSAQTITASAQTVLAHGLAVQPKSVSLWLENVTASIGYTTGQQVLINPAMNDSSDTTRNRAFSIIADATNITVRTPTDTGIMIGNASSGAFGAIVAANWKFVIKAKK